MSSSILSDMDWDEGLTMPVANASNKLLEDDVARKQKNIGATHNLVSENEDRVHAMTEHLKNVRQELQHTHGLFEARKHEVETEDHLLKIAQREEGRLTQEVNRLQKDLDNLKEKKNIYENNIFKQTQKLEELKSQMNWDHQALEAWFEESARKDEDAMTLQKYARQDEAKIQELSLKMEHLTDESMLKSRKLDHETTDTLTAQIELDKTAEEFRKAHSDRRELIEQWEHTIEQMQRRDTEMDLLAGQLARVKLEVRGREETIKEKQQFFDSEIDNNTEMEKKISIAERTAAKQRIDYQENETERVRFADELDALKRTVDRTATDLEVTRSQVSHIKKDVIDKNQRLIDAKEMREQLQEKLKVVTESELSAEERAAQMDELMMEEEKNQKEIDIELKRLRDIKFRKGQELFANKKMERNKDAEIQGSRAAGRNLTSKINKLDHDGLKQQEIIYNQDFAIQQLERRINRLQGETSNEEKVILEARIEDLTATLEERNTTHSLLSIQIRRLADDIRRVYRDLDASTLTKADMTSKIEELDLHNDNSQRELKRLIMAKQDLMVDENVLKLELKRLRDTLHERADDVLSLEKRRLKMETAMNERRHEINIHKEMLTAQLKAGNEEKSEISSELHERISKIDKLRKRYEILMVAMAPPEGVEERSQAYYVIKAAQDKEELQREGDDLDAKIRKAEKEIRALENTLRLMNNRNETYRKSFNKVTETSDEMEEKAQLEEQMRAVMDKFKYKRRQTRELQDDLQTMSHTMDTLQRDEGAYMEMIQEKQNKLLQLNKDMDEQRTKIDRVAKQNVRYAREMRTTKKSKDEMPDERDFELREMREFNKTIMKQVGETVHSFPDLSEVVHLYFTQANLPPPPAPGMSSRHSSRASSVRSSMSSLQSPGSVRSPTSSQGRPSPIDIGGGLDGFGSARSSASSQSTVRSGRSVASSRDSSRR